MLILFNIKWFRWYIFFKIGFFRLNGVFCLIKIVWDYKLELGLLRELIFMKEVLFLKNR